jgi:N-acyl homoserine lactone hydrolase
VGPGADDLAGIVYRGAEAPAVVTVYVLSGGYLELDLTLFLPDANPAERWTIPVPCYLVSHPRGFLLFDTGVHRQAITRLGERRAQLFRVRSGPGDHVVGQLEMLGLRPAEIGLVANSHFHFDHRGRNEFFPDATFLVQRRELAAARHPEAITPPGRYTQSARDFDHPLEYQLEYQEVDGEHDVFGDGRVVLFPTYGHTPGHQSLRVRLGKQRDLVFTANACYTKINVDRDLLSGLVWESTEMTRSLVILRVLGD